MRLATTPISVLLLASPLAAQVFPEPPVAPDVDPDPNVVEVHLTADETTWQYVDGVDTGVWAYNGSVPGPTIVANLNDTVRVVFTNLLDEPTTIHWHGVKTPAKADGSHISQPHVQPGETYTYEFPALNDGMHWYHPHVRTFDQVERGLYGVFLVRNPARETRLGLDTIEEHIVVFDDVLLDADNEVVPAFSFADPLQNALYHLNGREGNLLLVNGKEASEQALTVPNGEPQRWRVLNAANTTFCRLDLRDDASGISQDVWQIGKDDGFIDTPFRLFDVTSTAPNPDHPGQALLSEMGQGLLLFPGERYDVVFTPIGADGERFRIMQNDWFRGRHVAQYDSTGKIVLLDDPLDGAYPKQDYFELVLQGPDPGNGEHVLPTRLRNFPPLNPQAVAGTLPLFFGHGDPDPATGNVTLFAQAEFDSAGNIVPLPAPKVTSLKAHDVETGKSYMWQITNLTHGDHPFHSHGFPFQLVEYEFQDDLDPSLNFSFKPFARRISQDVIRVPARLGAKGTSRTIVRLKFAVDETGRENQVSAAGEIPTLSPDGDFTSGGWLMHCHILEHSAKGMLSFYEVRDPDDTFHMLGNYLRGTNGPTYLTAEGDLSPGSDVTFDLLNALPNTNVILVMGNFEANRSFAGGTLVPGHSNNGVTLAPSPRFTATFNGTTDANGDYTWDIGDWSLAAPGVELYWQVAFRDAGGPSGWAYSNALSFVRP